MQPVPRTQLSQQICSASTPVPPGKCLKSAEGKVPHSNGSETSNSATEIATGFKNVSYGRASSRLRTNLESLEQIRLPQYIDPGIISLTSPKQSGDQQLLMLLVCLLFALHVCEHLPSFLGGLLSHLVVRWGSWRGRFKTTEALNAHSQGYEAKTSTEPG